MKNILLGGVLPVPTIAVGCMRIHGMSDQAAGEFLTTAMECGMHFFDHADIYGGGKSEEVFAGGMKAAGIRREDVLIQTKCGIRKGMFDFSKQHILESVDGSLKRLNTDYVDLLLLHRPDALMEPDEVAEAFDTLAASGKVRHFGVSNQNSLQMELLARSLHQPIIANQLQMSVMCTGMIDSGLHVNMKDDAAVNRDGMVLDYCRLHNITIQPWSPFQYGFFEGVFLDNDKFPTLNTVINEIAAQYQVTNTAIAIAWLLRHPAKMQPVLGTTNTQRIRDISKATDITLTREEWYRIYLAAGNILP